MRRVVITGDGYRSRPSENTPQEVLAKPPRGEIRNHAPRKKYCPSSDSRSPSAGRGPRSIRPGVIDRRAMRFPRRGGGVEITSRWSRRSRIPVLNPREVFQRPHRHHHGFPAAPSAPHHRRKAADINPHQGRPKRVGPFAGAEKRCPSTGRRPRSPTWFQDQGASNYSISSACAHVETNCIGQCLTRPSRFGQARTLFFAGPAARSSTGPCRCCSTPWARCHRNITIRRRPLPAPYDVQPRRLCDRRRRRRCRGWRSSSTPRAPRPAPYLWRNRRFTGRQPSDGYEHGRAVGARAPSAVMPHGDVDGEYQDRLHQSARDPSTPRGATRREIEAIRKVFGDRRQVSRRFPRPKALTGHSLGATGVGRKRSIRC